MEELQEEVLEQEPVVEESESQEEPVAIEPEVVIEEPEEDPFVPAPDGSLYAQVDENHKLILINQIDAFNQGLPAIEYDTSWDGFLYEKGYAPEKPEEEIKKERIAELKAQWDSTDYKIIKCSECSLAGEDLPYDIVALHAQRQALRDEINQLENN